MIMGVKNNECIIVTTSNDEIVCSVKKWIKNIDHGFQSLFAFIPSLVNSRMTILMAPDGSQKGWDTSETARKIRDNFVNFLETFNYDDGSSPVDYVEVSYGEFGQNVLRGNCKIPTSGREKSGSMSDEYPR